MYSGFWRPPLENVILVICLQSWCPQIPQPLAMLVQCMLWNSVSSLQAHCHSLTLHTETMKNQQLSIATFLPSFGGQNGHGPKLRAGVLQGVYILPDAEPLLSASSDFLRHILLPSPLPSPWLYQRSTLKQVCD